MGIGRDVVSGSGCSCWTLIGRDVDWKVMQLLEEDLTLLEDNSDAVAGSG